MPIGVLVNCGAIIIGGLFGSKFGVYMSRKLCEHLTLIFAVCSLTIGVTSVQKLVQLPPVILAVILGTLIGEVLQVEERITKVAARIKQPMMRLSLIPAGESEEAYMNQFIAALVLFAASGTGIFGSLQEGITGDSSVLFAKAILDFFTAAIFASSLGYMTVLIAVPQFVVQGGIFLLAGLIMPLTNAIMIGDFTACGGALLLATGLRIANIKRVPTANMIPAMILVMPLSALWTMLMG